MQRSANAISVSVVEDADSFRTLVSHFEETLRELERKNPGILRALSEDTAHRVNAFFRFGAAAEQVLKARAVRAVS